MTERPNPWLRAVDWFIARELDDEFDGRRKARLFVLVTAGLSLMGAYGAWETWHSDPNREFVTPLLLLGMVLAFANNLVFKFTGRLFIAAAVLCVEVLLIIALIAFRNAGLLDSTMWFLPIAPVLAAFLLGPRAGVLMSLATVGFVILLYLLHQTGYPFREPGPARLFFTTFGAVCLMLSLLALAWLFQTSKDRAVVAMQGSADELRAANAELLQATASAESARDRAQEDARRKEVFLEEMRGFAATQEEALGDTRATVENVNAAIQRIATSAARLVTLAAEARRGIASVGDSGRAVMQSVDEMVAATGDTETAVQLVQRGITDISASVGAVESSALATQRSMNESARSVTEVEQRALATEELAGLVMERARAGREAMHQTLERITQTRENAKRGTELAQSLGTRTESIDRIVTVIQDVAAKTNLLSLNASIIAAQAGEQGGAFSVVASQIKELADRTASSTHEIAALIGSVQQESASLIANMVDGEEMIENGLSRSRDADALLEEIVTSAVASSEKVREIVEVTGSQTTAIRRVVVEMDGVTRAVTELAQATGEQSAGSGRIVAATERLRRALGKVESTLAHQAEQSSSAENAVVNMDDMVRQVDAAQSEQALGAEQIVAVIQSLHETQRAQNESVERIAR